jgi:tight adherence protein B
VFSVTVAAAVALAAAAGWVLPDGRRGAALARLGRARPPDPGGRRGAGRSPPRRSRRSPGRRRERAGARRRAALGELLDGLVAELVAGADAAPALHAVARDVPGLEAVAVAASRPTGDVAGALADLRDEPGGATAGDLAAVWRVAEATGCSLAAPVERLLATHRAEQLVRDEVGAQLAGPHATARLLSFLPLAGIAMGVALGADPVGFLTGTAAGFLCLAAGLTLVVAGRWWTASVAASVTDEWTGPGP